VQDACVRALRSFDQFRGGDARAWLLTIVRNVSYTFLSARKAVVEYDDDLHEPAADDLDPQLIIQRSTDADHVRHAIEQLPTELRTVIVLRELEELSYKEIAGATGMPIGTVMSRLSRGRERLAMLLTEPTEVEKTP